ncbi:putative swi snf family DNA-dependent atpase ris1 protein [Rosellinia necatrix]|uniref:Putative swi snf family DNA-dependent atpase ris1 protein n=1 Tax=Rosellinia necatrix TaxID=77044 RepID=A0A1W2TBX9_ROSNE|nr:putative swi snf family DNA-dependent atpase ris1 protein [Rosellinia necatrix]
MFKQQQPSPQRPSPIQPDPRFLASCARCGGLDAGVGCDGCDTTAYCSLLCRNDDLRRHRDTECPRTLGHILNHPIQQPHALNHYQVEPHAAFNYYPVEPAHTFNYYPPEPVFPFSFHTAEPHHQDASLARNAADAERPHTGDSLSQYAPNGLHLPDLSSPYLPPNYNIYDEKEQEAIRNLLDVPDVDIPISDRQKEPIALRRRLMPHQHVGLTWLINQEKSPHKGGILADDMGLGKTIQALALILCRPPEDGTRKTTLIVVPTSLLRQWEQEIDDKVKPGHKLKTIIFHSSKKRNMTVARLLSYDIVITTYGTLAHEWKQMYENRKTEGGMLLASHAIFHRIILDEAHNIKNRNSQSSRAVDRLHGTYRLCMTGTPLMNRLDEIYPLIRFLRIDPYREWDHFRKNLMSIKGGEAGAMKKLHVLLGRILLRRTENTLVDGQPILTLPELTIHTVEAVFDKDQREYYTALEQRSQIRMNRYLKEGTATRNYWYILLLILRLRQCCCHPYLIKDHAIPEGVNMTPEEMTKLSRKLTKRVVDRIKQQKSFECPMCHGTTENPVIIYPCGHHMCGDCITNMVSVREPGMDAEGDDGDGASMGQCPMDGCNESVDSKRVICYKNFTQVHLPDNSREDDTLDEEDDETLGEEDADEAGNLRDFVVSDEYESSDEEDLDNSLHSADRSGYTSPVSRMLNNGLGSGRNPEGQLGLTRLPVEEDVDSDDSLPPIEACFSHLKKSESTEASPKTPLRDLSDTGRNKRNNTGPSGARQHTRGTIGYVTDSEGDSSDGDNSTPSSQKRKRRVTKAIAKPKKKVKNSGKGKGKGKGRRTELTLGALKKSNLTSAAAKQRYFNGLRKDWEPSAKTDKAMELLGEIRRDFPDEKTLVFSQFTSFLDLMEIPISDDGYNYRRYDGSMSNGDRDAAVDDFMKKPEVKVMLVSLRCGNAGLNLYAATRVIMLDPFWNPSVEDQAIKRAHRLGQTKPVIAYRILVAQTVEDRILTLQEKKRQLVNDVLNAEARKGLSRLSISELAGLFGINLTR